MFEVHGYAAQSATTPLVPFSFFRRDVRPNDVRIDILFPVCVTPTSTPHTGIGTGVFTRTALFFLAFQDTRLWGE